MPIGDVLIGVGSAEQTSFFAFRAISWRPNGRLSGLIPQGTLMLGRPASEPGTV